MKKMLGAMLAASVFISGCSARGPRTDSADYTMPPVTARVFFESAGQDAAGETHPAASVSPQIAAEEDRQDFSIQGVPQQRTPQQGTGLSVRFRSSDQQACGEDGTALFISQIRYPEFSSSDQQTVLWLQEAVDVIFAETQEHAAEVLDRALQDYEAIPDREFYTYSYYADMQVGRMDPQAVSLLQLNSIYSGGAHPNNLQKAYNYDLVQRRQLELTDVLLPGAAAPMLNLILLKLEQQVGSVAVRGLYPEYRRLVTKQFGTGTTENWYFSRQGLTVYFNCYDIAPYAAGTVEIELRYEELEGLLQPAFFPTPQYADGSGLVPLAAPGSRNLMRDPTLGKNAERLLLSAEGTVADLRAYEISGWVSENAPIAGPIAFACDRLSGEDALELSTADGQEYLLVFCGAEGKKHACILSADGLTDAGKLIIN